MWCTHQPTQILLDGAENAFTVYQLLIAYVDASAHDFGASAILASQIKYRDQLSLTCKGLLSFLSLTAFRLACFSGCHVCYIATLIVRMWEDRAFGLAWRML